MKLSQSGTRTCAALPTMTPASSSISATERPSSTEIVEASRMVPARGRCKCEVAHRILLPESGLVARGHQPWRAVSGEPHPRKRRLHATGHNARVDSLRGHLLVASPSLIDPNFRRAVVLVTEHTDDGAAGLVLNRPSPVEVSAAVPQLEPVVDDGDLVWVGGPVQPEAVLVLGEFVDLDDAAVPLFGALGFPSLTEPEEIVSATTRRRVFAGYAGWGVGQLEAELADEDWILEPALADHA